MDETFGKLAKQACFCSKNCQKHLQPILFQNWLQQSVSPLSDKGVLDEAKPAAQSGRRRASRIRGQVKKCLKTLARLLV